MPLPYALGMQMSALGSLGDVTQTFHMF